MTIPPTIEAFALTLLALLVAYGCAHALVNAVAERRRRHWRHELDQRLKALAALEATHQRPTTATPLMDRLDRAAEDEWRAAVDAWNHWTNGGDAA